MRINPIPFLFLPGAAFAGWLWSGVGGLLIGLGAWSAIVAAATLIAYARRR